MKQPAIEFAVFVVIFGATFTDTFATTWIIPFTLGLLIGSYREIKARQDLNKRDPSAYLGGDE